MPDANGSPQPLPGWLVTVYYTAVERHHRGPDKTVTGCRKLDCEHGKDRLGVYPESFVTAVRTEGTGLTAAGEYLNWSHDTGFWLDTAPRDTAGRPLRPFESAAADPTTLPPGTEFVISNCGRDEDGGPVPGEVCARVRAAHWTVVDEFTPGLGGQRHVDLYIGEETGPGFTETPWYATLIGAILVLQ